MTHADKNNYLVGITYFIDSFYEFINEFDLYSELVSFFDENDEFDFEKLDLILDKAKNNMLLDSEINLFGEICENIENALQWVDTGEIEVDESPSGLYISIFSVCGIIWIAYEGDTFKYFQNKETAHRFIKRYL